MCLYLSKPDSNDCIAFFTSHQMLQQPVNHLFIQVRCVAAGKHLKPEWALRTRVRKPCYWLLLVNYIHLKHCSNLIKFLYSFIKHYLPLHATQTGRPPASFAFLNYMPTCLHPHLLSVYTGTFAPHTSLTNSISSQWGVLPTFKWGIRDAFSLNVIRASMKSIQFSKSSAVCDMISVKCLPCPGCWCTFLCRIQIKLSTLNCQLSDGSFLNYKKKRYVLSIIQGRNWPVATAVCNTNYVQIFQEYIINKLYDRR